MLAARGLTLIRPMIKSSLGLCMINSPINIHMNTVKILFKGNNVRSPINVRDIDQFEKSGSTTVHNTYQCCDKFCGFL